MSHLHACHECDLLIDIGSISEGQVAGCPRCGCEVIRRKIDAIRRTKVVAISGLIFFVPAIFMPLMAMHAVGRANSASLLECVEILLQTELYFVALIVALTSIIAPLFKLTLTLYISCYFDTPVMQHPYYRKAVLIYHKIDSWEMLEVFMMGILVSIIKLQAMAVLTFGMGLVCFVGLLLCVVALRVTFDIEQIWERIHEH
ncbi:paraquat-inducible protein A [Psychromonas sp. MME2]|uniref:paraquat-inducible protein A n=1 Tax=unclassified Psychromonas TaxID=2614957 RepID=UPI00339CEC40